MHRACWLFRVRIEARDENPTGERNKKQPLQQKENLIYKNSFDIIQPSHRSVQRQDANLGHQAGGVPVSDRYWWPGGLGSDLEDLSKSHTANDKWNVTLNDKWSGSHP